MSKEDRELVVKIFLNNFEWPTKNGYKDQREWKDVEKSFIVEQVKAAIKIAKIFNAVYESKKDIEVGEFVDQSFD